MAKPEVTNSPQPNVEVKNMWSFISAAQYAFKILFWRPGPHNVTFICFQENQKEKYKSDRNNTKKTKNEMKIRGRHVPSERPLTFNGQNAIRHKTELMSSNYTRTVTHPHEAGRSFTAARKRRSGNGVPCTYNSRQFGIYGLCTAKNSYIKNVLHMKKR